MQIYDFSVQLQRESRQSRILPLQNVGLETDSSLGGGGVQWQSATSGGWFLKIASYLRKALAQVKWLKEKSQTEQKKQRS